MKMLLHVAGMLALGLLALVLFAALVQIRTGHPADAFAGDGSASPSSPTDVLSHGVAAALNTAASSLRTNRAEAVPALDAALRASELGLEVSDEAFRLVHEAAKQARRRLQNGNPAAAEQTIRVASAPDVSARQPDVPTSLEPYRGATVINARGERIGEVAGAARREGGVKVRLLIGGVRDAFGFIDIGGKEVWVDSRALLYGKVKDAGTTLVGLMAK